MIIGHSHYYGEEEDEEESSSGSFSGDPVGSTNSAGTSPPSGHGGGGFHRGFHGYENERVAYEPCDLAPPPDDPEALRLAAGLSQNQKTMLAHVMQALGPKTVWDGLLAGKKRQQGTTSPGQEENGTAENNSSSSNAVSPSRVQRSGTNGLVEAHNGLGPIDISTAGKGKNNNSNSAASTNSKTNNGHGAQTDDVVVSSAK